MEVPSSTTLKNKPSQTRLTRSSTLPSNSQTAGQKGQGEHEKSKHFISHRHHKSHQIHIRDAKAVALHPHGSQLSDLLGPVRSGLSGLGAKPAASEAASIQEKSTRSGGTHQAADGGGKKTVSKEELKVMKDRNLAKEREVSASVNDLSSKAIASASSLATAHGSLVTTLNATSNTLARLSNLLISGKSLLEDFTARTVPEMESSTRDQLAALQRTYEKMEKQRLLTLEWRVKSAKKRVETLKGRLEACKEDVEREEQRSVDEMRRRRRNAGVFWGALFVSFTILLVAAIWQKWPDASGRQGNGSGQDHIRTELEAKLEEDGLGWVLGEGNGRSRTSDTPASPVKETSPPVSATEDFDRYLGKLFDEI